MNTNLFLFTFLGNTLHLSGVDIINGMPGFDIKTYVPSYDNPNCIHHQQISPLNGGDVLNFTDLDPSDRTLACDQETVDVARSVNVKDSSRENLLATNEESNCNQNDDLSESQNRMTEFELTSESSAKKPKDSQRVNAAGCSLLEEQRDNEYLQGSKVGVADWINSPPIKTLDVRFTANAETELKKFLQDSNGRY